MNTVRLIPAVALVSCALTLCGAGCAPERGTIGAMLGRQTDGRLFVRDVPRGLAADRAGVKPGDEVLLIDGRDVRQLDERGVHRALAGEVDEPVKLTLQRGMNVLRVTVKRMAPPRHVTDQRKLAE